MRWVGGSLWLALGLGMVMLSPLAGAQEMPCVDDVQRYCADVAPGGGRLMACMKSHEAQLTAACAHRVVEISAWLASPLGVCRDDWVEYCYHPRQAVQIQGATQCLQAHQAKVSPACQKALRAGDGKAGVRSRDSMP
jgi:hypothetical protein